MANGTFGGKQKGKIANMEVLHCLIFAPLLTHSWQSISPWVLFANCKQRRSQINVMAFTNPPRLPEKLGGPLLGCFVNILWCFNIICVLQMQSEKTFQTMCIERVHCWCFSDFCKGQAFVIQHQNSSYLLCVIPLHIQSPFRRPAPLIVCVHDCCSYVPQWPFLYHLPFKGHTAAPPKQSIYFVKEWDFTGQPKERTAYFCNFEHLRANSQIFFLHF